MTALPAVLSAQSFEEIDEDRPGIVATNTIYRDSQHPSRLYCP